MKSRGSVVKVILCKESEIPKPETGAIKPVTAKPIAGTSNDNPESRYSGRTNPDLKEILKKRGLPTGGNKKDFLERLVKYDQDHGYHGDASASDDNSEELESPKKKGTLVTRRDIPIVMQTGAAAALSIAKASKKTIMAPPKAPSSTSGAMHVPTYNEKTTNKDLQVMCTAVNLPKTGKKSDLLGRLDEFYGKSAPADEIQVKLGSPHSSDDEDSGHGSGSESSDDSISEGEGNNVLEKASNEFLEAGSDGSGSGSNVTDEDDDGEEESDEEESDDEDDE